MHFNRVNKYKEQNSTDEAQARSKVEGDLYRISKTFKARGKYWNVVKNVPSHVEQESAEQLHTNKKS